MKNASILFGLILCVFLVGNLYSQDADTVVVDPGFGTLNIAVTNDTTEGGVLVNSNRVYKLKRGGKYILNGRVTLGNSHFRLVGEPNDGVNPPAMIQPGIKTDGTNDIMLELGGDITLKNISVINFDVLGNPGQRSAVRSLKDSAVVIKIDRCLWEHDKGWENIKIASKNARFYLTNSIFRNLYEIESWWGPRVNFFSHQHVDTVVCENNTFAGVSAWIFQVRKNFCNHFWFNHNTIYHTGKMAFLMERWSHCITVNNLFIDCHVAGESFKRNEVGGQDVDGLLYGIFNADTLETYNSPVATNEAVILLANNAHYRNPKYDAYYQSTMTADGDSVFGEPFMNTRTQGFFDNLDNWKLINLWEKDPQFTNPPDYADIYIQWLKDHRADIPVAEREGWSWDPDAKIDSVAWPLSLDMSYSNSELLTGGTDGLPLGDLNWYPDKLMDWETNKTTYDTQIMDLANSSNAVTAKVVPAAFAMQQNYPNPFNPMTIIAYSLQDPADVQLAVLNAIGQKVKTLVDKKENAGEHNVKWDGTDNSGAKVANGLYFYRLRVGDQSKTMKMLLIK